MRYYKRFPDRALAGMASLNLEQRGAYNSLIDLLYSRDGIVADDDHEVAHALTLDRRQWRRLKLELIAAGKVRIQGTYPHSYLQANGVDETIDRANFLSKLNKARVEVRWKRSKSINEIKGSKIRRRNTIENRDIKKETVANKSEEETEPEKPAIPVTKSLEAVIRAKGWV